MKDHMIKIVGFTGLARHGKTTSARHLRDVYGFVPFSFAEPLRQMLLALGVDEKYLTTHKLEGIPLLGGKPARYALQTLGTEWGRNLIDKDLWVRAAMARVDPQLSEGLRMVCDDVRFDNEAQAIIDRGGIVVKVRRPGMDNPFKHASEMGVSVNLIHKEILAEDVPELLTKLDILLK